MDDEIPFSEWKIKKNMVPKHQQGIVLLYYINTDIIVGYNRYTIYYN